MPTLYDSMCCVIQRVHIDPTQIQYVLLDSADDVHVMVQPSDTDDFTDLAIDSPNG